MSFGTGIWMGEERPTRDDLPSSWSLKSRLYSSVLSHDAVFPSDVMVTNPFDEVYIIAGFEPTVTVLLEGRSSPVARTGVII